MIDDLVEQIEARFAELQTQLSDPDVIGHRRLSLLPAGVVRVDHDAAPRW